MYKMDLVGMGDMVDLVDKKDMVVNENMVDSIYIVNIQKYFGHLKLLVDTSGWTRWTW